MFLSAFVVSVCLGGKFSLQLLMLGSLLCLEVFCLCAKNAECALRSIFEVKILQRAGSPAVGVICGGIEGGASSEG